MFRGTECQGEAQGLGCEPLLAERSLHVGVIITAGTKTVSCVYILLAKQPPSWGIQLSPPCERTTPAGLVDRLHFLVEGWGGSQDPHLSIQLPLPPAPCNSA